MKIKVLSNLASNNKELVKIKIGEIKYPPTSGSIYFKAPLLSEGHEFSEINNEYIEAGILAMAHISTYEILVLFHIFHCESADEEFFLFDGISDLSKFEKDEDGIVLSQLKVENPMKHFNELLTKYLER